MILLTVESENLRYREPEIQGFSEKTGDIAREKV